MYTGGLVSLNEEGLNASHDDYFEHNIPGCLDLAKSPFLEPIPSNPQAAPWMPFVNLKPVDCAQEKSLGSHNATRPAPTSEVVNGVDQDIQVFRLQNGQRDLLSTIKAYDSDRRTNVSRAWVVADAAETCLGIIQPTGESGRVIVC